MEEEEKMCSGCLACSPEGYSIEVTAGFLRCMRTALTNLQEQAPDYSAPGWLEDCENYIIEIEKKYNQKFDLF